MTGGSNDFNLYLAANERQQELADYMKDWARIAHWTNPVRREDAERAVEAAYATEGMGKPVLIFCESLWQMAAIAISWSIKNSFQTLDECSLATKDLYKRSLWFRLKDMIEQQGVEKKLRYAGGGFNEYGQPRKPFDLARQLESKFKLRATELFVTMRREELPASMLGGLATISNAYNNELVGEPQDFVFLHQDLLQNQVVADVLQDVMHVEAKKMATPVGYALYERRFNLDDWLLLLPMLQLGYTVREIAQAIASDILGTPPPPGARSVFDALQNSLINTLSVETDFKFWLSPWAVYQLPPYFYLIDCIESAIFPEATRSELEIWRDLARSAFAYLFFPEICLVCERPASIIMDERGRLHNEEGPAVRFNDDYRQYFWQGRAVTRQIVETPETITVEQIERESNAELKRILIERYGLDRFILNSKAVKLSEDDAGVLYRKDMLNDEPIVVVKVKNSTAEPDGSYRNYFLRVPPRVTTAREAVAWTFHMLPFEYEPCKET